MKEEPRIPTLLGLAILLIGIGSAIFIIEKGLSFFSHAQGETATEVTVANVSDAAFSVSWLTDKPIIGAVEYSEKGLLGTKRVQFDVRDQEIVTPRYTHFVTVNNLKTDTKYEVTLVTNTNKKETLSVKTGPTLVPPDTAVDPAFGNVIDTKNMPAADVLVHASFDGSQIISTLTDTRGNWVLPLGSLRSQDASSYFVPSTQDQERLFFVSDSGTSIVTTGIDNDSPLPLVRLGESYDFTRKTSFAGPIIAQAATGNFSNIAGSVNAGFAILSPAKNSSIPSGFPAIKGTGTIGKDVIISISETPAPVSQRVKVTSSGTWSWTPKSALSPGKHLLSASSVSSSGVPQVASVSFNILKSGTNVMGDATGSGTLSSPSPIASASPRASVSPQASATASPSGTIPTTGTTQPTLILAGLAVLALALGTLGTFKKL